MRFDDYHAFKRHVAELAGLDPTTVERNDEYRQAIINHLAKNPRTLLELTPEIALSAESKAQKFGVEIELANVKRDNERLRLFIQNRLGRQPTEVVEKPLLPSKTAGSSDRRDFEDTATVLARLLEHLAEIDLGIVIDASKGQILNIAEIGDRAIIAAPPQTKAFLKWMERHNGRIAKD
jgi:hypothetical protein